MAHEDSDRGALSRERWAAQIDALDVPRKEPVTPARVVAAALRLVESDGFDQLTMRKVASELGVTPGALYVHVRDKAELGNLMLGDLCSRIVLPTPDASRWRDQVIDVCRQLLGQYVTYPGMGYAVFASAPQSLEVLRIMEGLLQILTTAGADVQAAAWAVDAALVFIAASGVMSLRRSPDSGGFDRDELIARYRMLPRDRFPVIAVSAEEITAGALEDRFVVTLDRLFSGLVPEQEEESHHEI